MYTETIQNPKTGRQITVRCWNVSTVEALKLIGNDGVKALSWALLNDSESVQTMEQEQHGDEARNNFALSVFEHALDWSLGMKIYAYLQSYRAQTGKLPRQTKVVCTRNGDVYVMLKNGQLW